MESKRVQKWKWGRVYTCKMCGITIIGKKHFIAHKQEHYKREGYKCRFCGKSFQHHWQSAAHSARCELNPNYQATIKRDGEISKKRQANGMPEEQKKKISTSLKEFLKHHPESMSYKYNHYSKGSWAEDYFRDLFIKENIKGFVAQYRCGTYRLDFAFPTLKIDFEIDGHQHYVDKRIIEHDRKRTSYLEHNGWKVIRVRWSDFQKLSIEDKQKWIEVNLYPFIKIEN